MSTTTSALRSGSIGKVSGLAGIGIMDTSQAPHQRRAARSASAVRA